MKNKQVPKISINFICQSTILLLCVFVLIKCYAEPFFNFDYIDSDYGISNSSIEAIVQDNDGYIWLGTQQGVFKFDGLQATHYYRDGVRGSLLDDDIYDLLITKDNTLWVATTASGVARFDRKTQTFTHISDTTYPLKIGHFRVKDLKEFGDDIWLLNDNGVEKVNKKSMVSQKIPFISNEKLTNDYYVRSIAIFRNRVWTSINGNLYQSDISNSKFELVDLHKLGFSDTQLIGQYKRIFSTGSDLFAQTKNGFYRIDFQKNKLIRENFPKLSFVNDAAKITTIIKDIHGTYWVTIVTEGVFYKQEGSDKFIKVPVGLGKNQLNSTYISTIYEDDSDNLWLGTDGEFLAKFRSPFQVFPFVSNIYNKDRSTLTSSIWSYANFNNETYVGTGNGVFVYRKSANGMELKPYLMDKKYQGAYALLSLDDKLLIGTNSGLFELLPSGVTNDITGVVRNNLGDAVGKESSVVQLSKSKDHLFIGTYYGLIVIDRQDNKLHTMLDSKSEPQRLQDDWVVVMEYDKNSKRTWLGFPTGAQVVNVDKSLDENALKAADEINLALSIIDGPVNDFYFDDYNHTWIATDSGLYRFTSDNDLLKYFFTPESSIKAIEEDRGHLWLSVKDGLLKVSKENLSQYEYFTTEDGVYNKINIQKSSFHDVENSMLYFGGDKGFVKFNSEIEIPLSSNISPHLGSIRLINQNGFPDLTQKVLVKKVLAYDENSLRFDYSFLDFKSPKSNRFKYKLDGFDNMWSPMTSQNNVTYTNMPSGKFTFRLKAYNANGIESENELSIPFEITPIFWKSGVALILYSLIAMFSIFSTYYLLQNRQEKLRNVQLQKNKEAFISGFNKYAVGLTKLNSYQTLVRYFLDQLNVIAKFEFLRYQQLINGSTLEVSTGDNDRTSISLHKEELITENHVAQLFLRNKEEDKYKKVKADVHMLFQQMIILQSALMDKQKHNWNDYFYSVTGLYHLDVFVSIMKPEIERAKKRQLKMSFIEWEIDKAQFRDNELLKRIQLLGFGDQIKYVFGHHVLATCNDTDPGKVKFIVFLGEINSELVRQFEFSLRKIISENNAKSMTDDSPNDIIKVVVLEENYFNYIDAI